MHDSESFGPPIVQVEELTKTFQGRAEPVLHNLSLSLRSGEFALVMGRSGSGKSTLLHCIAGLESFDNGEITLSDVSFLGKGVEELAALRLQSIGIVFQFFNLIGSLTLRQNIALPAALAGRSEEEYAERVEELAEKVGISSILEQYPYEVSGGEAQRAAIARALLLQPKVILADEPTGNLDERNAQNIFQVFRSLAEEFEVGILMVSHERDFASKVDTVYEMTAEGTLQ